MCICVCLDKVENVCVCLCLDDDENVSRVYSCVFRQR